MQNLDILILSSVVTTLFLVFIGYVGRELIKASKEPQTGEEGGPRADLVRYVGKIFDSEEEPKNKKIQKVNIEIVYDEEADSRER